MMLGLVIGVEKGAYKGTLGHQHWHAQLWEGMLSSWRTCSSHYSPVDIEIGVGESRHEFESSDNRFFTASHWTWRF